jgi:hypothetical protein
VRCFFPSPGAWLRAPCGGTLRLYRDDLVDLLFTKAKALTYLSGHDTLILYTYVLYRIISIYILYIIIYKYIYIHRHWCWWWCEIPCCLPDTHILVCLTRLERSLWSRLNSASFNLPFSLRPLEKHETTKAGCMETCQHSLSILQL